MEKIQETVSKHCPIPCVFHVVQWRHCISNGVDAHTQKLIRKDELDIRELSNISNGDQL
ncbi:MAG: hypothetical protein WC466_03080 [Candidatus Izemoplasmatales bacterium]|jgi:hypothetical protein